MTFPATRPPRWRIWGTGVMCLWLGWAAGWGVLGSLPFSLSAYLAWLAWSVAGAGLLVVTYRLWALLRLRYTVTRDGITVHWGWSAFFVPMHALQDVRSGPKVNLHKRWWRWPALYVGHMRVRARDIYGFGTLPWDEALSLCGPRVCVVLTPADRAAFLTALNQRRRLGPTRNRPLGWSHPAFFRWSLWRDAPALGALVGLIVLLLVLWGEVAARGVAPGSHRMLTLATLMTLGDGLLGGGLYPRHRWAALLLWWGGVTIVGILLLALWTGGLAW